MIPGEPRVRRPRLLTWLLLLLLALVGWGLITPEGSRTAGELQSVQRTPPPVTPATGRLAAVFEAARPATVRVESLCENMPVTHAPLGTGTGFFVSESGLLLTAYHVVRSERLGANCDAVYRARTESGDRLDLELVGFDAVLDVALLKAATEQSVPWLPLANSLPRTGTPVVVIGNSRGDFLADRAGAILRRDVTASQVTFASGTLEMSASLAPGDSGGPVLNEAGEVLGVVSYISFNLSGAPEEEGLIPRLIFGAFDRPDYTSYAVPVLADGELHSNLLAGNTRDVPVIGFELQFNYVPGSAGNLRLGSRPGVVVGPVQPGGPGDLAGLRGFEQRPVFDRAGRPVGTTVRADVITALNGSPTPTFDDLLSTIYGYSVGDTVRLSVQRDGSVVELELTLAARRQVFGR